MPKLLGDRVESALALVGVTKRRVTNALGRDCGCAERQEKLNDLDRWARRVFKRGIDGARTYLDSMIKDWDDER